MASSCRPLRARPRQPAEAGQAAAALWTLAHVPSILIAASTISLTAHSATQTGCEVHAWHSPAFPPALAGRPPHSSPTSMSGPSSKSSSGGSKSKSSSIMSSSSTAGRLRGTYCPSPSAGRLEPVAGFIAAAVGRLGRAGAACRSPSASFQRNYHGCRCPRCCRLLQPSSLHAKTDRGPREQLAPG